jgi:hypothetical protein
MTKGGLDMKVEKLVELYNKKLPNSHLTGDKLTSEIARLLENNFSVELIFFSINYCSKYYSSDVEVSLYFTLLENEVELKKYFEIAKAKRDRKALKESEAEYDQKNYYKGANTPSWFGKSFDKHLFE